MKSLITVFILSLLFQSISAQKNFEGRIVYTTYSADDTSLRKEMIAYLKGDKIFIDSKIDKSESMNFICLYDFGKGKAYRFNYTDSIALYVKMTSSMFPYSTNKDESTDSLLKILNYSCRKRTSVIYPPINQYFKKVENWFTDNIFFKVNDTANFMSPPFIFFSENSISLKTKISFNKTTPEMKNIIIEATAIKEEKIDDSIFQIPKCMAEQSLIEYSNKILEKFKTIDNDFQKNNDKIIEQQKQKHQSDKAPNSAKGKQSEKSSPTKPKQ